MEDQPSPRETLSRFEELLAGLARAGVEYVGSGAWR